MRISRIGTVSFWVKSAIAFGLPIIFIGLSIIIDKVPDDQLQNFHQVESSVSIPTSLGGEEDPGARFDYEISLQVDPKTGQIPWGIYQKEKEFVSSIPRRRSRGTNLRTNQTDWEPLGPTNVGGRTRAFKVDVTNNDVLMAGSVSGGMWRSEDRGRSWARTTEVNALVGVTALAQDSRAGKENIWYYGTGEIRGTAAASGAPYRGDGVFKSTDGGLSWLQLESTQVPVRNLFNSQFNYVYDIIIDHTDLENDVVFLAVFGGILRSNDGGESWTAVLGDKLFGLGDDADLNGGDSPFFTDVIISDSGVLYGYLSLETSAGYTNSNNGVFRSEDGINWVDITPIDLPDSSNRAVMALAPTNQDLLYMFVDHGARQSNNHSLWSYRHEEPVGQWSNLSENVPAFGGDLGDMDTQGSYNMVLTVHPNDEDIVFVGGTNLYRSLDGFRSTEMQEWVGGYDTVNTAAQWPQHHADQHSLYFLKDPPFGLYSTHDGGISFTNASTLEYPTWISLNSGYISTQFYTIELQQDATNNFFTGGAQDNGSWIAFDNDFGPWNKLLSGDGSYSAIGERARFFYASSQRGRIFRIIVDFEENRFRSLSQVDPLGAGLKADQRYLFINPFILDPNDTDRMYVAGGDAIWRNQNVAQVPGGRRDPATEGWDMLGETALDSGRITALVASVDVKDIVYYGTDDGRMFRIDSASSPQIVLTDLTNDAFPQGAYLININVNPEDANELLVVFSSYNVQSIFHSLDGGFTFEVIGGNLEEFEDGTGNGPSIRWGVIAPLSNGANRYYVGTSTGIYSTELLNGSNTVWLQEGSNTVGQSVVTMIKYRPLDGRIAAATHGNGAFFSNVEGFKSIAPPSQEPAPFDIAEAFPNPFSDRISVEYTLPEDATILARIFDLRGNLIKVPLFGTQLAGTNSISWDGRNNLGEPAPDGIYVLSILYNGKLRSRRFILNR